MTSAFERMKASRDKALEALEQKLNQTDNAPTIDNSMYWKPTRDQSGNGSAVIRFLGPSEGEDVPFVKVWSHAFQGPTGQWYIEKSLTTIGQQDYIGEHNKQLWATGIQANKNIASSRKRKLEYISNIYVIKDPNAPDNEGKVFKYKYGQKIFDMIKDAWKPEFDDQEAVKPFDPIEGSNMMMRIKTEAVTINGRSVKVPNYTASSWAAAAPLFKTSDGSPDGAKIGQVWENQYKLDEELAESNFKSADDLKTRFLRVIGEATDMSIQQADDELFKAEPKATAAKVKATAAPKTATADVDEDSEDWFKDLDL